MIELTSYELRILREISREGTYLMNTVKFLQGIGYATKGDTVTITNMGQKHLDSLGKKVENNEVV